MTTIESAAELYVHALAIEREAARRYGELAARMAEAGNDAVAALFRSLAEFETGHLEALKRRTAGLALPPLASDYTWLECDMDPQRLTPRQALTLALQAEKDSRAFFEQVCRSTRDAALCALAREMAAEENEHIATIERALAGTR
jgi:rubrerythrin